MQNLSQSPVMMSCPYSIVANFSFSYMIITIRVRSRLCMFVEFRTSTCEHSRFCRSFSGVQLPLPFAHHNIQHKQTYTHQTIHIPITMRISIFSLLLVTYVSCGKETRALPRAFTSELKSCDSANARSKTGTGYRNRYIIR